MDFSITHRCNIIRTWLLISILSGFQCLGQLTVTVNNVETATEGDASTTISCTYSGFAETPITIIITWEKTDLDTGQKEFLIQQFDGFPDSIGRYSVEGQATLRITGPVTIEDRGRYTCKITIIGSLTSGTEQAGVELVIHSPVQDLIMGVEGQIDLLGENDMVTMIEGRPITIICWAKQANPAADVLWYLGNEQIISGVGGFTVESNTEEVDQPGDNRLNTVSKLTFSPIYNQHQNHVLMCTAQNEVMTRERTLSVYPRILVPPSQHYVVGYDNGAAVPVIENQVFTISCRAEDSYPLTQLIWYLNGELIETGITTNNLPSSDGRVSVMSTWTYMASRAKGDDGATIQCEASGEPLSSSNTVFVTLEILYPPTDIQIIGDNTDFKAGEQASGVLCSSSGGKPDARVSWWKDNQEKVSEVLNSNRLEVEMTAEDNGQSYTCMSSNDANIGNPLQRNSAPLNVLFPPACVHLNGEGAGIAGEEVTLTCSVCSSNPAANIYWKKDNVVITGSALETLRGSTYSRGQNNGEITEQELVLRVSPSYNGAKIQCFGKNQEFDGTETSSEKVTIDVLFPPTYPDGCVTSLTGYREPLKDGDSLTLLCTSCSSNPAATIRWYRDDQEVQGQGRNQDMLTDGLFDGQVTAQDITIQMSRHHHGSRYHCSAVNRMVPGVPAPSQQIVLEVEYKPVIVNKEANNKAAASSREEAVLQCQSDSNPAPQVYWFHGNKRVISDGVHYTVTLETEGTITTSFLRITSVQPSRDYGTYNCTTNTTMGMDSFLIDLQGKRIPDPVNDMQVIHMTDTTVTVSWQPGFDGGEEQLFHLKYRLHGNHDDVWMQSTSTVQPPLVLRELKPSTEYEIIVVSENSLGSAESNPIVRQTLLANFGTKSPQTDKRSSIGVPIGVAIAILAALVVLIAVIVIICKRRKSKKGEKPSTVCANVEFDSRRNNQHQNDLSLSYFTRPPAPEPPLRSVSVPAENLPYNVQPTLPSQNQTKRHYPEEEIYSEVPAHHHDIPDDDEAPPSYHHDSKWSGRQVSKPKT